MTTLSVSSRSSFNVNDQAKELPKDREHSYLVEKLTIMLVSVNTTGHLERVTLLCTRVQNIDGDDYMKLTKLLQYLREIREPTLTIDQKNIQTVG